MLVGKTAVELVRMVRAGEATPVQILGAHLDRVAALDRRIGAFETVRAEQALAEAEELENHPHLAELPLAGIPIAIKDNLAVAGETPGHDLSGAPAPSEVDHEVVRRLRAAGAIVVGLTRMPQLAIWGTSDCPCGVARNPWNLDRSAGGSSGGSAAAVAAGMTPIAIGNDGMGSIRVPAASCGVFGIKPGAGRVPSRLGTSSWMGLAENGPLAATVADAALALSVMTDDPGLAAGAEGGTQLRIAVSTKSPLPGLRVDAHYRAATLEVAALLRRDGHSVREADPPYSVATANALVAWWAASVAEEAASVDPALLERRARGHLAMGRLVRRRGWVKADQRERWKKRAEEFFTDFDVLLTPALARRPPKAGPWANRSWLANIGSNAVFAPFAAPWNFAAYPAAAVPAGMHPKGVPLAVQLVGTSGAERVILEIASLIERAKPWPLHVPL